MFLSERREFPSAPCLTRKNKLDDSSRLDVVEMAPVPDMLPILFPSWSGLRTYQHTTPSPVTVSFLFLQVYRPLSPCGNTVVLNKLCIISYQMSTWVQLYIKQTFNSSGDEAVISQDSVRYTIMKTGWKGRNWNTLSLMPVLSFIWHEFYEVFCGA